MVALWNLELLSGLITLFLPTFRPEEDGRDREHRHNDLIKHTTCQHTIYQHTCPHTTRQHTCQHSVQHVVIVMLTYSPRPLHCTACPQKLARPWTVPGPEGTPPSAGPWRSRSLCCPGLPGSTAGTGSSEYSPAGRWIHTYTHTYMHTYIHTHMRCELQYTKNTTKSTVEN